MNTSTLVGRTKEQMTADVDAVGRPRKAKEELRGKGWAPHRAVDEFEDDVWNIVYVPVDGYTELQHRELMNRRLDSKPFEKLRPRTQAEILEANREAVLIMRECDETSTIIAKHWGVTRRTVDNFFKVEDMKEAG